MTSSAQQQAPYEHKKDNKWRKRQASKRIEYEKQQKREETTNTNKKNKKRKKAKRK